MLGATAGGFALGTAGTAAAHAIQYPVGALTHTPHGVGVGALLPYVMEFNRPARVPELAAVAPSRWAPPADASAEDLADEAIDRVAALLASVGIPATLAELGLPADQLRWTAEQAMGAERLVANNPRPLDVDTLERIVRAAHAGDRAALREAVPIDLAGLDRDGRCAMTVMDEVLRPVVDVDRGTDRPARGRRLAPRRRRASAGGRRPGHGLGPRLRGGRRRRRRRRRPSTPPQLRPRTGRRRRPAPAPTS